MKFVDLYAQYQTIREEIDAAIARVIADSAFVRGRHVADFETAFAKRVGVEHCVSCANGTDALYIAMKSLGLRDGDEVITTAHSWIATSETVTQAGGQPVFCDTEQDYFCLDPSQIESKITPRTRGIIPVHLYGQPVEMDTILQIAKRHELWVIEDCAQAHLATYRGQMVGTMGDAATFSFYPGKNLGAMGDAGCLVTNRDDVADFAGLFANHGGKNQHLMEGINSRLDGLQAAILNVKLAYLPEWTEARQQIANFYDQRLAQVPGISIPNRRPGCGHVFHLYVIQSTQRDALREHLRELDIPTSINYPCPLPLLPAYRCLGATARDFPTAVRHAENILALPLYPELNEKDMNRVVRAIETFQRKMTDDPGPSPHDTHADTFTAGL